MQNLSFYDTIASSYDQVMEEGVLSKRIREEFHEKILSAFKPGDRILDLGCGTGIDAAFAAAHGISVVGIEQSPGMLAIARQRMQDHHLQDKAEFMLMDVNDISALKGRLFDGVISNFNCLNYLTDANSFSIQLTTLLKPGSTCIITVLNSFCLAEVASHLVNCRFRLAWNKFSNRGNTFHVPLQVCTAKKFFTFFSDQFILKHISGYGIILPPDPMSQRVVAKKKMYSILFKGDKYLGQKYPFYNLGDHYIIELTKK